MLIVTASTRNVRSSATNRTNNGNRVILFHSKVDQDLTNKGIMREGKRMEEASFL